MYYIESDTIVVARFVIDGLKLLGVNDGKVLLIFSDAALYMVKTGQSLAVFYPNLIHVICVATYTHVIRSLNLGI